MKTPLLLLLALAVAPLAHAQIPPVSSSATTPAAIEAPFSVARKDAEAVLTWNISTDDVFTIELFRNTVADTKSRTRVGTVAAAKTTYTDSTTDKATTYWYWLKVIRLDRSHFNIGPVKSAPAEAKAP